MEKNFKLKFELNNCFRLQLQYSNNYFRFNDYLAILIA